MAYTFDGPNKLIILSNGTTGFPYVYKLTHKETGEFYYGSRYSKKIQFPPERDLIEYQTSSKTIKSMGFENFDFQILAVFFTMSAKEDAYDLEQELIFLNNKDPLILNRWNVHKKSRFINFRSPTTEKREATSLRFKNVSKSEEQKEKIGNGNRGKTFAFDIFLGKVTRVSLKDIDGVRFIKYDVPKQSDEQKLKNANSKLGNSFTKGKICYYDPNSGKEIKLNEDVSPPEGFIKGKPPNRLIENGKKISNALKGRESPTKGSRWCINPETGEKRLILASNEIPPGWKVGMKI